MSSELPQFIAPGRLAKESVRLEGQVELHKMARLAKLLTDTRGTVNLELFFFRNEDGLTCVTGRYDTALQLTCQRCLEPVTVKLADKINVGITIEGASNKLPASFEPLVLAQDSILLADFLEEEILLGLPISPMHELRDCSAGELVISSRNAVSSPFQVLETLKSG